VQHVQKVVFLQRMQREREKFELLLNRVGYSRRMTLNGVAGSWSVKDILAHILAYEQYIVDRMEEIHHGQDYVPCKTQTALDAFREEFGYPDFGSPLLDDDGPNAWVVEKYKTIPLDEIVAQELQAYSALMASLERMPEDAVDIRRWLKTIAVNSEPK
jgi:CBS domain containing-hemolysin-like protein